MKNIKVVIGANFGDEGKGLMTDYLSSSLDKGIVVRFNGGAQAGHTVTTPDGKRHVFGHIGSGSFNNLPTYLSSFFIVNPMVFHKELNTLKDCGLSPVIFIDKDCLVTTPYDMMLNQIAEIVRGSSKHGSCGMGINETITRSLFDKKFLLSIKDLENENSLREKLLAIRNDYVFNRLQELGIELVPKQYLDLLKNDNIIDRFIYDIKDMLEIVTVTDIGILSDFNSILFEGAQGLLLDQSHEYFPHVTRSNTGMKNVKELLYEAGLSDEAVEIVYATRAYLTRHGAGPFPTELSAKPYSKIKDLTNVPNPYQDSIRFGHLDLDMLSKTIHNDLCNAEGLNYNAKLSISCIDQLDEQVDYVFHSKLIKSPVQDFIDTAFKALCFKEGYLSYGSSRATIKEYK